jgi:hypothetical protein
MRPCPRQGRDGVRELQIFRKGFPQSQTFFFFLKITRNIHYQSSGSRFHRIPVKTVRYKIFVSSLNQKRLSSGYARQKIKQEQKNNQAPWLIEI